MSTPTDDEFYRQALAGRVRVARERIGRLDPETTKARNAENTRRHMEARRRATQAIANLHPEEFARLRDAARREVDAERGPLPGDSQ